MKKVIITAILVSGFIPVMRAQPGSFNLDRDLLLMQFDCKTDVDDVHSAAALATLLSSPEFKDIDYHAVAGTYGIQEGLYVPANEVFEMAFEDNWTDAHTDREAAVTRVSGLVKEVLAAGGDIWIADAGQSDFSAMVIRRVSEELSGLNVKERIHVVQHSDWNEEVTSPEALAYVKMRADYHKIPDGNAVGNGTPGFRTPGYDNWGKMVKDPHLLKIWELAVEVGNRYNGQEGRYNNEAVASGGLDFSDLAEVCWILGLEDIRDTEAFFERFTD